MNNNNYNGFATYHLIPPEVWEKSSKTTPPPPVKKIQDCNDHSYNNWTQVRLHQDPYLKTEKRKRDPITIPIVETGGTLDSTPSFKTKAKRKRIIGSAPVFKTESTESETDTESSVSWVHSKYIQGVLRRKVSHNHTFGVYQDDTNGFLKVVVPSPNLVTKTCL
jgi:hypothetical protein